MYQQGRLVICCDEKTGMQALGRPHPTQPAQPGKPARREQDYIRYGTRALIASLIVPTGEIIGDLGPTQPLDFAAHLGHVAERFPEVKGFDWVLDNLNTHWSLAVCRIMAQLSDVPFVPSLFQTGQQRRAFLTDPTHKHVFHFTPTHGSWLNQVELWFSVFERRFLKRGDFSSMADFEARLLAFSRTMTDVTPIRTVGLIPGHLWCEGLLSVKLVVSNSRVGRGLVHGRSNLSATSIPQGRISVRSRKLGKNLLYFPRLTSLSCRQGKQPLGDGPNFLLGDPGRRTANSSASNSRRQARRLSAWLGRRFGSSHGGVTSDVCSVRPQSGTHTGRSWPRTVTNARPCTSGTAHSTPPPHPAPSTSSPTRTAAA